MYPFMTNAQHADLDMETNRADELMRGFSRVPETAFLHHPTYKFHIRATKLLKQWQQMISEYEAKGGWILEYDRTMDWYASSTDMFKFVYRQPMRA
ncbi:hypothetical protein BD779DRAFT_1573488 [Infundibulicybe gibba]|nr:hypothetical protein BD779DRAFT_1573488 [Infundibulicybe gibba]